MQVPAAVMIQETTEAVELAETSCRTCPTRSPSPIPMEPAEVALACWMQMTWQVQVQVQAALAEQPSGKLRQTPQSVP
jgi:hypothetical protein